MSSKGIIVVGSLHHDIIVDASHQPVKGETLHGSRWYPKFGGKGGNQAVAASLLGTQSKIVSAIGDDNFGKFLLNDLKQYNVDQKYIQIKKDIKTGISIAISDDEGEYGAVIVSGANLEIDPNILNDKKLWQSSSILMIQNEVRESLNLIASTKAKENGLQVCLNAAPSREISYDLKKLIDILIVNSNEASEISKMTLANIEDAKNISKILVHNFKLVIITLGEDGVVFCEENQTPIFVQSKKIEVKSTHGAGDVFAGIFCSCISLGMNLIDSIKEANENAALHVSSDKNINKDY